MHEIEGVRRGEGDTREVSCDRGSLDSTELRQVFVFDNGRCHINEPGLHEVVVHRTEPMLPRRRRSSLTTTTNLLSLRRRRARVMLQLRQTNHPLTMTTTAPMTTRSSMIPLQKPSTRFSTTLSTTNLPLFRILLPPLPLSLCLQLPIVSQFVGRGLPPSDLLPPPTLDPCRLEFVVLRQPSPRQPTLVPSTLLQSGCLLPSRST